MGRRAREIEQDTEECFYLGYRLVIGLRRITIYSPAGRELGRVKSMESARRFVRAYRKEEAA